MHALDSSPLAAQIAREALAYRGRGPDYAGFAASFERLADVVRGLDRLEGERGLQEYLAAGHRSH